MNNRLLIFPFVVLILVPGSVFALSDPEGYLVFCIDEDLNEVDCSSEEKIGLQRILDEDGKPIPANSTDTVINEHVHPHPDEEPISDRVTEEQLKQEEEKAKEVLDNKPQEESTIDKVAQRDVEDVLIQPPGSVPNERIEVCGKNQFTNIVLPFTMTVKYPQTLGADITVQSLNPEKSVMKLIQDKDFFTVETKESVDSFTIVAEWEYTSKPNDVRFIDLEIYSDNSRIQQQSIQFDALEYCHLFLVETKEKVHVPTLEEFQKENDIQINKAFDVVAQMMLNNNDLTFILILVTIVAVVVIAVLIGILIYVNREMAKMAEEASDELSASNSQVLDLIGAIKILARSDVTKNQEVRDSILQVFSIGSTNISNIIIDLRKILHETIRDIPGLSDVHLKSEASKEPQEIEDLKKQKKESEPGLKEKIFKKKKKDETTIEFYFEKYQDMKKYPTSKLEKIDSHLRIQYEKTPTEKIRNEIEGIGKVIKKRMGLK